MRVDLIERLQDLIPETFEKDGDGYYDTPLTFAVREAIAALSNDPDHEQQIRPLYASPTPVEPKAEVVGVKALEWTQSGPFHKAGLAGFKYEILDSTPAFERPFQLIIYWLGKEKIKFFKTLAEAQAYAQTDFESRIRSALTSKEAGAPEGWKLVPVEPTKEMTLAAHKAVAVTTPDGTWALARDEASRAYRAMLAASPPNGESREGGR